MTASIVLYSFFRSSCAWRVRMALEFKKVNYEIKSIDLSKGEQKNAEYLQINPSGQIPSLIVKGKPLTQSMAILEYLEEAYPNNNLLPKDLFQRAKVREICEIINSGIQPLQNPSVAAHRSNEIAIQKEWIKHYLIKGFNPLEKVISGISINYCVGSEVTLADCCFVPQIFNAIERFRIDMSPYPTIMKVYENLINLDCVQKSHPKVQVGFAGKY